MKISIIISIIVLAAAGALTAIFGYQLQPIHYTLEIQGMKDAYEPGEQYSFYYTLTGFGNTCHSLSVFYPDENGEIQKFGEAADCLRTSNKMIDYDSRKGLQQFSSYAPKIEGTYNVTVKIESVAEPAVHTFTVISKESDADKRRIGWTPAFEYNRVQINGTSALQICSLLNIPCPKNPVFDAVNRHDKNYTYFYYELPDKEYLVILDDGRICYTTDDVDFENTGIFEECVAVEKTVP